MPANNTTGSGATEIFRMPAADSTVPDLMGAHRPAHPTLTIVKGPQIGEVFELDSPQISLGRDPLAGGARRVMATRFRAALVAPVRALLALAGLRPPMFAASNPLAKSRARGRFHLVVRRQGGAIAPVDLARDKLFDRRD